MAKGECAPPTLFKEKQNNTGGRAGGKSSWECYCWKNNWFKEL